MIRLKSTIIMFLCTISVLGLCSWASPRNPNGPADIEDDILMHVEYSAGLNAAYPNPAKKSTTPAPDGKVPFGIIYYGRHGSCYLSKPSDYEVPYRVLATADSLGKLTPLGKNVLDRLNLIREDAHNHWGELTDQGICQQQEIVGRLIECFPEVLCKDAKFLGARSLRNTRSLLSMEQLMMQIARKCDIRVYHNASNRFSDYLSNQEESRLVIRQDSLVKTAYDSFARKYQDGDRLLKTLVADQSYVRDNIDVETFNDQMFKIAGSIQNTKLDGKVTLYDLFTKKEIYHHWKKQNAWNYVNYGNYARRTVQKSGLHHHLLRRLIAITDTAQMMPPSALFHFADETSFVPFVSLLEINGYGLSTDRLETLEPKGWADYRICPMSANVTWVLYHENSEDKDVLIKVLLNGEEVTLPLPSEQAPYYSLQDFRDYYLNKLNLYEK